MILQSAANSLLTLIKYKISDHTDLFKKKKELLQTEELKNNSFPEAIVS